MAESFSLTVNKLQQEIRKSNDLIREKSAEKDRALNLLKMKKQTLDQKSFEFRKLELDLKTLTNDVRSLDANVRTLDSEITKLRVDQADDNRELEKVLSEAKAQADVAKRK